MLIWQCLSTRCPEEWSPACPAMPPLSLCLERCAAKASWLCLESPNWPPHHTATPQCTVTKRGRRWLRGSRFHEMPVCERLNLLNGCFCLLISQKHEKKLGRMHKEVVYQSLKRFIFSLLAQGFTKYLRWMTKAGFVLPFLPLAYAAKDLN